MSCDLVDYETLRRKNKISLTTYFPDHQARKVFNDLLGFRSLCDNYDEVLSLASLEGIRFADMTKGKAIDDGYRGIHVYYQRDSIF